MLNRILVVLLISGCAANPLEPVNLLPDNSFNESVLTECKHNGGQFVGVKRPESATVIDLKLLESCSGKTNAIIRELYRLHDEKGETKPVYLGCQRLDLEFEVNKVSSMTQTNKDDLDIALSECAYIHQGYVDLYKGNT